MKKILVVEDDEVIRNFMKELLEMEGYTVECATNGEEGLQALRQEDNLPGLILLDISMPVKDGFQFRKEQLEDQKLANVPVVVMTADGSFEEKKVKLSAKDAIKKPFDIDRILSAVKIHCLEITLAFLNMGFYQY